MHRRPAGRNATRDTKNGKGHSEKLGTDMAMGTKAAETDKEGTRTGVEAFDSKE